MADRRKQLMECARAHNNTLGDVCEAVWDLILAQEAQEQEAYFSTFLSQIFVEDVCTKEVEDFLPRDLFVRIAQEVKPLGDRVIENLIQQRLPEEAFYKNLWDKISDTTLLPDRRAQVAFLAWLWLEERIPYYQIGEGCAMENEEFAQLRDEIWPVLKKAFFILSASLRQKTQWASLLMQLADGIEDERARTVFWACVMGRLRDSSPPSKKS